MSKGSNVAAFVLNIIFIIFGIGGLGFLYYQKKDECHRILAIILGFYVSEIIFLSILYRMTSKDQETYDENENAGEMVGKLFWFLFIVNFIMVGFIGFKIYMWWKTKSTSFGKLNKLNISLGGLRNSNSNVFYKIK